MWRTNVSYFYYVYLIHLILTTQLHPMTKLIHTFLLALLPIGVSTACSCWWNDSFCDYVGYGSYSENNQIYRGSIIGFDEYRINEFHLLPLVLIEVKEKLYGDAPEGLDTIALVGQDGLNCAMPLPFLGDAGEIVFFVEGVLDTTGGYWSNGGRPISSYPVGEFPGCGPSFLKLEDGILTGKYRPGQERLAYVDFVAGLENCLAFSTTETPESLPEISVYPNPASQFVTVKHPGMVPDDIRVVNAVGQELRLGISVSPGEAATRIEIGQLPVGVYTLLVRKGNQTFPKKLVVNR